MKTESESERETEDEDAVTHMDAADTRTHRNTAREQESKRAREQESKRARLTGTQQASNTDAQTDTQGRMQVKSEVTCS